MRKFSHPVYRGKDYRNLPVFCAKVNDFQVHDPMISECGRFEVDPQKEYGLSHEDAKQLAAFNKALENATSAALNAGCMIIQDSFGIPTGDLAAQMFDGDADAQIPIRQALLDYLASEYAMSTGDTIRNDETPHRPTPERG